VGVPGGPGSQSRRAAGTLQDPANSTAGMAGRREPFRIGASVPPLLLRRASPRAFGCISEVPSPSATAFWARGRRSSVRLLLRGCAGRSRER
jgi:hypothetical protein